MSNSVIVGQEKVAKGTLAASLTSIPCLFVPKEQQKNVSPAEVRNSQDEHFTRLAGLRWLEWDVKESYVYHDSIGIWLASAFGSPVVTTPVAGVKDNTFKLAADPKTLSLQWDDPRRSVEPRQSLYNAVDSITFSFAADGTLTYACSGVGKPDTAIGAPTYSFSTVKPIESWRGAVTLDGVASYLKLVSGSIKVMRNRKPFHTIANSQSPQSITIGKRSVEVELVVDLASATELTAWRSAAATAGLTITWVDDGVTALGTGEYPEFELKLGTLLYESAEKDWEPDSPQVKVTGRGLYNATDASSVVARVQSTVDFS